MSPRTLLLAILVLLISSSISSAAPNRILMRFGRSDPNLRPQNAGLPSSFFRSFDASRFGDDAPSAGGNYLYDPVE
ncbi:hypothetical protein L596_016308 [Steinernema carpocapsae]|uniref:Uncharacterized protein n=1 Tax=Steinernema carpocapsae TaxID=34508 RepID=A0A4V6A3D4_STECR|nr:hypothetical protein L596_016308 [Steinernema carpocapsae]